MIHIKINDFDRYELLEPIYKVVEKMCMTRIVFFDTLIGENIIKRNAIKKYNTHILRIDINSTPVDCIKKSYLDMVECNRDIIINGNGDLREILEFIGGDCYIQDEAFKLDLSKFRLDVYGVLHEIFGIKSNKVKFYPSSFTVKVNVDAEGDIYVNNNYECNVKDIQEYKDVYSFLCKIISSVDYNVVEQYYGDEIFDVCMDHPFIFLGDSVITRDNIIEFKYNIYSEFKDLKPSDYSKLNVKYANFLNSIRYIPLCNIKKIIMDNVNN